MDSGVGGARARCGRQWDTTGQPRHRALKPPLPLRAGVLRNLAHHASGTIQGRTAVDLGQLHDGSLPHLALGQQQQAPVPILQCCWKEKREGGKWSLVIMSTTAPHVTAV